MIQYVHDDIGHHGQTYMRRWMLWTRLGTLRVHHICTPDEPALHDHPWWFVSLVVRGWYRERHHDGRTTRRAWMSVGVRAARELHYIDQVSPGGCWTVAVTGPKRRGWGFVSGLGWLPWRLGADAVYGRGEWS